MRKGIIWFTALLLFGFTGLAAANEGVENEGVEVEAGVKIWNNTLKLKDIEGATLSFKPTILAGPVVEVKFPFSVFVEASYLLSTSDYKYSDPVNQLTADRKDLEAIAGYEFLHLVGVYVGYKQATSDFDGVTFAGHDIELTKVNSKLYGFLAGIRAKVPVYKILSVYGNFTLLHTKARRSGDELPMTEKAPGTDVELGVQAEITEHLSANVGYRKESTKSGIIKERETFAGMTFGAAYAFE